MLASINNLKEAQHIIYKKYFIIDWNFSDAKNKTFNGP